MTTFFTKHSTIILITLLITMLALARIFPSAGLKLGITFLLGSFLLSSFAMLEKHKNAYRNKEITREVFIRNAVLEISGGFVVMLLAGLLGRNAAEFATQQIRHDLIRVIAGIAVGLLVGISVGAVANKTLRRWVQVSK